MACRMPLSYPLSGCIRAVPRCSARAHACLSYAGSLVPSRRAKGAIMSPLTAGALLELRDLRTWFPIRTGVFRRVTGHVKAVDGVELTIFPGETLALVGES